MFQKQDLMTRFDLNDSLLNSHKTFLRLKDLLIKKESNYFFKTKVNLINIFSSNLTLYYIHPYLIGNFFSRLIGKYKFYLSCFKRERIINRSFEKSNKNYTINKENHIILLCFSFYISKDSLFDLIPSLLKYTKNNILILYDDIESSEEKIFENLKIKNPRIKIIPIQSFYTPKDELIEKAEIVNITKKLKKKINLL